MPISPSDIIDFRKFDREDATRLVTNLMHRSPDDAIDRARKDAFGKGGLMKSFLEPNKPEADRKIKLFREWQYATVNRDEVMLHRMNEANKERAIAMYNAGEMEYKTLSPWVEGTNSLGGYNAPPEYAADLARNLGIYGIARRYFRHWDGNQKGVGYFDRGAGSYIVNIPYLATKPTSGVNVTAENNVITSSRPTEGNLQITLKKLAALTSSSNELLEDINIDYYAAQIDIYSEQFQIQEDTGALQNANTNWNGLLWYGAGTITGNLAANGAIAVSRANSSTGGKTGYPQVGDAAADSTDAWADLLYMLQQQPSALYRKGVFFIDQNVLIAMLSMRDTQHRFIADIVNGLKFETGLEGQPVMTFRGYEMVCVPSGIMLTYDASPHVSTPFTIFCNPQASWAVMTERGGFRVDTLREGTIESVSLADNDLQAIRMVERVGFGCALPYTVTVLRTDAS